MADQESPTAPITSDDSIESTASAEEEPYDSGSYPQDPPKVLVTSVLNSTEACGAPVSIREPRDQWRQRFSVYLGQGSWALLYKLQCYTLEELRGGNHTVLTKEDLGPTTVQDIGSTLLNLFVDNGGQHINTRIRPLKKYPTLDGKTAKVVSHREINRYIGYPLVLIEGEDPVIRPMHKGQLIADNVQRGQRLTRGEKRQVARVLERILQGVPTATLAPKPVHPSAVRHIFQLLSRTSSQDCDEPFDAYGSPFMAETMLMIYYRHRRRGCNGTCSPCDTVDAMIIHTVEVCNADYCPQRKFLVTAYAKHVREARCDADPTRCSIPFCGQTNFLVRPHDDVSPSLWLGRMVVEKIKYYNSASA